MESQKNEEVLGKFMKCYCVKLTRMKAGGFAIELSGEEIRLFSSMEATEKWLMKNGFLYGQRRFFRYPDGDREWFHKDDIPLDYINVVVMEMNVDDLADSEYKNFDKMHQEEGLFVRVGREEGLREGLKEG